jgi:hypothetical protein
MDRWVQHQTFARLSRARGRCSWIVCDDTYLGRVMQHDLADELREHRDALAAFEHD